MQRRTALAAIGSSFLLARQSAGAQGVQPFRVIGPPIDAFKGVYYGVHAGIFRKLGLNVEASTLNSGAAAAAALIGGTADVGYTNITTLINAYLRGIAIQIVSPGILNTPDRVTVGILVRTDSPIHTGRDLVGKTVASVDLSATAAAGTKAWVEHDGGDPNSLKFIEAPTSTLAQMVVDGRAAAAVVNEPALSQAVALGTTRVVGDPMAALSKRYLLGAYAVIAPAAEKEADAMRRFATGMHAAQVYCNTHLVETADLVAGYSGIPADVVAHSVRVVDSEYVDADLVQPIVDALAKFGVTARSFSARDVISPYALRHR